MNELFSFNHECTTETKMSAGGWPLFPDLTCVVLAFCDGPGRRALRLVCTATSEAPSPTGAALWLRSEATADASDLEAKIESARARRLRWWGTTSSVLMLSFARNREDDARAFRDWLTVATRLLPGIDRLRVHLDTRLTPWLSVVSLLRLVSQAAPSIVGVQAGGTETGLGLLPPRICSRFSCCNFPHYQPHDGNEPVPLLEGVALYFHTPTAPVFQCARLVAVYCPFDAALRAWLAQHMPVVELVVAWAQACPGCFCDVTGLPGSVQQVFFATPMWCSACSAGQRVGETLPCRCFPEESRIRMWRWSRHGPGCWVDFLTCDCRNQLRPQVRDRPANVVPAWASILVAT